MANAPVTSAFYGPASPMHVYIYLTSQCNPFGLSSTLYPPDSTRKCSNTTNLLVSTQASALFTVSGAYPAVAKTRWKDKVIWFESRARMLTLKLHMTQRIPPLLYLFFFVFVFLNAGLFRGDRTYSAVYDCTRILIDSNENSNKWQHWRVAPLWHRAGNASTYTYLWSA